MIRASFAVLGAIAAAAPALAQPDPAQLAAAQEKAKICAACHGEGGNSLDPQYPILAGQSWRYIYIELKDFKEGRRSDPQMSPMAASLSQDDMVALGNYFAAQKQAPIKFQFDGAKIEAGRKVSDAALCPMCHLGGFVGQNEIPRAAGQWPQYVKKQLEDFRAKRRTNDAGNMTSVAAGLSDADIENLSQYIGNLGP
ncbi:MAG TPA: c-type cytochrome [Casimicrobiaceae bacterium]|nr:c-type cytochrome [Casimicrobiaceae bacterium]